MRLDDTRLKRKLGQGDRRRIDNYLSIMHDVDRQIQRAEAVAAANPLPDLGRPKGVPAAYRDDSRLMFDLQLLAYQGAITRVITFQRAHELTGSTCPEVGVPDPHHPLSHHGNDPEKVEEISRINSFHVSLFAEYSEKLKASPDGDGSRLDQVVPLYGSGTGNPSTHDRDNLPILVSGGASCGVRAGRHARFDEGTPPANLHLTVLDRVGVRLDSFGDSNGKFDDLLQAVPD